MNVTLTYTDAQATRAETALRNYYPWDGVDSDGDPTTDTRTVSALITQFVGQHLGQLIVSKEGEVAKAALSAW